MVKSTWLAVETVQFPPGLEIPEAGRLVVTGGEAEFTIGRDSGVANIACMTGQAAQLLSGIRIAETVPCC